MSLIKRGIEARAGFPVYANTYNPLNVLYGQTSIWSSAGERVDEVTALGVASVLSAVGLLADSVATMNLRGVRHVNGQREIVPLPSVLADPDPAESNRYELIHMIVASTAMHGNAYVKIDRDSRGNAVGLLPLHPYQVNVLPDKEMSGRAYLWLGRPIPREDMLHIRWFTPPQGLVGISPLLQQRTMVGLAIAMDKYLAQWYGEGATPSGVLETDRPLTKEAMTNLRESWESSQRKRRRPALLTDGLKWRPVNVSAVDMDFVNVKEQVLTEVARIFRIPPYMLNVKSASQTYQNNEAAALTFLTYTLAPWITRLETALSRILPPGLDVEFDPSSLLRLDALTKARVQMTQIQSGTRTPNEARALDGLPPYPGGDEFVQVLPGAPMPDTAVTTGTDNDPKTPAVGDA